MQVNKWGPPFWKSLNYVAFGAPIQIDKTRRIEYYMYFKSVSDILPCKYCRDSYKFFFKYLNIKWFWDTRMGLTYWLFTLHNLVNTKLKKPINTNYYKFVKKYEKKRAGCSKNINRESKLYKNNNHKLENDIHYFSNEAIREYGIIAQNLYNNIRPENINVINPNQNFINPQQEGVPDIDIRNQYYNILPEYINVINPNQQQQPNLAELADEIDLA